MRVPISEHFHSLQGEGTFVGTPMHFIRLAGCSVGQRQYGNPEAPLLPSSKPAWGCKTWDGRSFWCDTDFNKRSETEISSLISETWEKHLCLTGGEPLIHREEVNEIISQSLERNIKVHIETSGTILPPPNAWITISPKIGSSIDLQYANEIKLLISEGFDDRLLPPSFDNLEIPIFISPVNEVSPIEKVAVGREESVSNLQLCLSILKRHPRWRLSVQLHKFLGLR